MIEALPYAGYEYVIKTLEEILARDDSKFGYFVDVDLNIQML